MLKAILVDLDGTLVDSEHANAAAYAAALAELGVQIEPAALLPRITGRVWRDFLPALLAPGADPAAIARRKRALYPGLFHLIRPNLALAGLVRVARAGGLATALVTTAAAESTDAILRRFELQDLFDAVICGDDVSRAKPDPEAYQLAASRLGVTASQCLIIEDSEVGLAAAAAFGGHTLRWCPPAPRSA